MLVAQDIFENQFVPTYWVNAEKSQTKGPHRLQMKHLGEECIFNFTDFQLHL